MSVYTHVARHELDLLLENYAIGALLNYEGIADGVINSNYFVNTSTGNYVLTLFETINSAVVENYLALMQFYTKQNFPVPKPIPNHFDGHVLTELNGKPAVLVQRLMGAHVNAPTPEHCAALGSLLGKLHCAGRMFPQSLQDNHGRQWRRDIAAKLSSHLPAQQSALLQREMEFQNLYRLTDLPMGVIHTDLFRDNVLFADEPNRSVKISAVLDWYNASSNTLLYDLAVAANDWCIDADGQLLGDSTLALLNAYHEQRALTDIERGAWPVLLRLAALRFWLSRLNANLFPRAGNQVTQKNPEPMLQILNTRIAQHDTLHDLWVS